jgi:hypothetical protein
LRKSTNFTFEYDWQRLVARRLATSSLPPASTRMYSCAILALLPVGKFVSSTCSHPFWMAAPSDQTIPRRRKCERPLAVAPTMPNFDPGVGPCCDPLPRSLTGVGISGDEINYRGADLPLPKPSLIHPCDFIPIAICHCTEAIYHPFVDP